MHLLRFKLLLPILLLVASADAQSIDLTKSTVSFKVGNMWIHSVHGTFTGLTGNVTFDPASIQTADLNVCVDARTANTGNKGRDEDLRSDGFLDVGKYPTICYHSTTVEKTDKGFLAKGKLTMHGLTKEVAIPFTYANKTLTGTFTVSRSDYGIGKDTGTFMVGDEVEITVVCVIK